MAVQDYELLLRVRADLAQAIQGLDGLKKTLGGTSGGADKLGRSGKTAATGVDKLAAAQARAESRAHGLTNAWRILGATVAAVGVAKLAREYIDAADAMSNLSARLSLVTTTEKNRIAVQQALFTLAQSTGQQLETTADLYVKLAQSSDYLRTHQTDLLRITESVGKAMALSGADTATANGVVRQLSQSFASGVLRGDEFNSMMEGAPRLAKALADGLGVPVGALRAMAAQGELTTDKIQTALLKQSNAIDSEFAKLPLTVGRATTQLKNSLLDFVGGADEASGASKEVAESISDLASTMSDPDVKSGFASIIAGLVNVANFAAKAASAFAGFGKAIADTFRDNENKSYDGLLQKRMSLDNALTTAKGSIAAKLGVNKGEVADLTAQLAAIDKVIRARNAASSAAGDPSAGPSGLEDSNELPTATVYAPKSTNARSSGANNAMAQARAAATAQGDLIKALVAVQAAIDPAAAAWSKYNDQVDETNALALAAKQASGANVEAINAERDAIIQAYAAARDKSIADLANKDREAFEKLRDSLRTPAEVKVETAIEQIKQLNEYLIKGIVSAGEYQAMMAKIGDSTVTDAPKYQGVDAAVAGPAGELIKNMQFQEQLNAWHETALQENEQFRQRDIANEQAAADAKLKIEQQFAAQSAAVEQARRNLAVNVAVAGFTDLANAAKNAYGEQSKQYRVAFALQKAAALAQSILAIQTSIAESSKLGYPWNIVSIAGAVAQGISVLATINSTNLGGAGYAEGGYTGAGGKYQPAGVVHAGEVVWSQSDISRAGGVGTVEALRLGFPRYAEGGIVGDIGAMPDFDAIGQRGNSSAAAVPQINQRIVVGLDTSVLDDWASSSSFEKAVKVTISKNPSFIRNSGIR